MEGNPYRLPSIRMDKVLFTLRWRLLTQILMALPVLGLFICLFTSLVYHVDHINNTICKVYNFLPSISAVTGVSPQRYLWRVCVALHISPRMLVACVSREYLMSMVDKVPPPRRSVYSSLVTVAFCLNITELVTLCGVTYISNKENYPIHEKLFMVFMLASLIYMVIVVQVLEMVRHALSPKLVQSLSHKRWLLGTKVTATFGLLFFFWRHRVYCQPKAFSWFSLCEYVMATCNMLYHVSVAMDFSEEHFVVGHISSWDASPTINKSVPQNYEIQSYCDNPANVDHIGISQKGCECKRVLNRRVPEDASTLVGGCNTYCINRSSGGKAITSSPPGCSTTTLPPEKKIELESRAVVSSPTTSAIKGSTMDPSIVNRSHPEIINFKQIILREEAQNRDAIIPEALCDNAGLSTKEKKEFKMFNGRLDQYENDNLKVRYRNNPGKEFLQKQLQYNDKNVIGSAADNAAENAENSTVNSIDNVVDTKDNVADSKFKCDSFQSTKSNNRKNERKKNL